MIAATDAHATIEELLQAVFSVRFVPRLRNEEQSPVTFVNHVKYLGVISDKRITWRLHIEVIEAKVFRTFITFKRQH
jgi:hypothetical protein